jgi:hypothetical protein
MRPMSPCPGQRPHPWWAQPPMQPIGTAPPARRPLGRLPAAVQRCQPSSAPSCTCTSQLHTRATVCTGPTFLKEQVNAGGGDLRAPSFVRREDCRLVRDRVGFAEHGGASSAATELWFASPGARQRPTPLPGGASQRTAVAGRWGLLRVVFRGALGGVCASRAAPTLCRGLSPRANPRPSLLCCAAASVRGGGLAAPTRRLFVGAA